MDNNIKKITQDPDGVEYTTVSLPVVLIKEVDQVILECKGIYSSRPDFIKQAIKSEMKRIRCEG